MPYKPASRTKSSVFIMIILPRGVLCVICSTAIDVLEVPIKWKRDRHPLPRESIGPSLVAVSILKAMS